MAGVLLGGLLIGIVSPEFLLTFVVLSALVISAAFGLWFIYVKFEEYLKYRSDVRRYAEFTITRMGYGFSLDTALDMLNITGRLREDVIKRVDYLSKLK